MVILDTISVMPLGYTKYAKINIVEIAKVIFNPRLWDVSYSSFSGSKYIIFIILR